MMNGEECGKQMWTSAWYGMMKEFVCKNWQKPQNNLLSGCPVTEPTVKPRDSEYDIGS